METTKIKNLTLYCDGASKSTTGYGSFGAYLLQDGVEISKSGKPFKALSLKVTNNQMELMGFISPIMNIIKVIESDPDSIYNIMIVSDSQYLIKGISEWILKWRVNGWKASNKKQILNYDLWQIINNLLNRISLTENVSLFKTRWVKGHKTSVPNPVTQLEIDIYYNNKCDDLANQVLIDNKPETFKVVESSITALETKYQLLYDVKESALNA